MATPHDLRPLAVELLDAVEPLARKLQAACELSEGDAPQALVEVLRFLELVGRSGERLTPSQRVDLAWHELILCTRQYATLCTEHFGRFIHHSPGGDEEDNHAAFARTLQLYAERFGPPPSRFWADARTASACGSCDAQSAENFNPQEA